MMGWWKPYFFLDVEGVQLFFEWATIEGPLTLAIASSVVALLSVVDRWAAHYAIFVLQQQQKIGMSTAIWTLQRFTSGLLMLAMMSFNVVIFVEVVVFSGLSELGMRLYWTNGNEVAFQRLVQSQVEVTECC